MKKEYICSECKNTCIVEYADNAQVEKSVTRECEYCHKQTKMYLGDDISYGALTRVDVNENTVGNVVIPDTKNVLCESSLANLVTLRATIRTVYALQAQINILEEGIKERSETAESLINRRRLNKGRIDTSIGHGFDYDLTYAKIKTELLEKNRKANEADVRIYALKRSRKFTALHIGITVLLSLAPVFAVLWYTCFKNARKKNEYMVLYQEKHKEIEEAYIASEQYKNDLQKLLEEDFSIKRKPYLEDIEKIDTTLEEFKAQDERALADIAVLKKALMQEVEYIDGIYCGIIHKSDWENLDYIIYAFMTGRADNLKEALHLVDEHGRTETIVNAVGMAASYLASNISSSISSIKYEISQSASRISADLSTMQGAIELQNKDYQSSIDRVVDINKNICDYSRKSYDMMYEINKSLRD